MGYNNIDISSVPFEEEAQVRLLSFLLKKMAADGGTFTLKQIVDYYVQQTQEDHAFAFCTPYKTGSLAFVRTYELAAAINRYRMLQIK